MPYNPGLVFHTEFTKTKVQPRLEPVRFVAGLDVAQQNDWTGLVVLELIYAPNNHKKLDEVRLVALERWQKLYPYTLEELGVIFSEETLKRRTILATDATGPGLHLYEDMVRDEALISCVGKERITPVVITPGQNEGRDGKFRMVPKHLLITRLQSAIRRRQIRVPRKLPLYNILESELEGYEMKLNEGSKRVTFYNNPRDGGPEHDDTILALALAHWCVHYKPKGSTKLRVVY
jgi:phage FluMu gp28-like protein